ncbi:MAG: CPBP family intramembrane metalloprotease [Synergistetes bacterium]|nr:CPBP family intramembrane metalloprotease [Synergistota bacterium]MCX8127196.1 CPBP family intramembrane metalloprotease [Synergistota bacterium]MDW8191918.1 CPBP family intramembrane glutamic endopeptidase [Synergistota bacterium]
METRFLKVLFSYIGLFLTIWLKRDLAIAYMLYLPLLIVPKKHWESYGITLKSWEKSLKLCALASLIFLLPFTIASIALSISQGFRGITFSAALYQFIGVALPEELFFRGYLQTEISKLTLNPWKSIILTSILFTVVHLFKGITPVNVGVFLPSLIFGYLREETGSILASTIFHALSNIIFFSLF